MLVAQLHIRNVLIILYKYHVIALNSPVKLSCTLLGSLAFCYSDYVTPKSTGFYCDDRSISHKYKGDTVQTGTLLLGCFVGPVLLCLIVEAFRISSEVARSESFLGTCKRLVAKTWFWSRHVITGGIIVLALTELAKNIVSEPRPHFLDTCKPNVTQEICNKGFVSNFTCVSDLPTRFVIDSQKSFPSGHTALSVFVAVYCIWYTQIKVTWKFSSMLRPFLQATLAAWAAVCSLTRITDRRHHWWDVLAGAVLGGMVAFVIFCSVRRSLRDKELSSSKCSNCSPDALPEILHNGAKSSSNYYYNNKRQSVRRLVSTSSSIVEDREMANLPSPF